MPSDFELRGTRGRLIGRRWDPAGEPTHVVLLVHGYGEHAGRYAHVAERLAARGAVVYAPDHYGHGRSEGERAVVDSVDDMVTDVAAVAALAGQEHPGLPVAMIGHSLGGIIATRYVQTQPRPAALVLSGPVIGGNPAIAALLDMDPIPVIPIDPAVLSRDPAVGEAYAADELVYHGGFDRRTLTGIFSAVDALAEGPGFGELPVLWLHGEEDALAPYDATRPAIERLRGPATEEKVYPEARHEIFNETNQDEVIGRVADFVDRVTA
jgi:alpha-beta hydrolase superfamily lysophospholipase